MTRTAPRLAFRQHFQPRIEPLEDRRLLTVAYINEIYFNAPRANQYNPVQTIDPDLTSQYIELRGTPGMSMDDIYLIGLENENNGAGSLGTIDFVLGFQGKLMGSNGFLTVRQKGNPYTVETGTTDLVNSGSGDGFGSDISSSVQFEDQDNNGQLEGSGGTYMLIQTIGHVPGVGDDLDLGEDGLDVPTGHADWTILDSVGFYGELNEAELGRVYSPINFGVEESDNFESGAIYSIVPFTEIEYVGRWGQSTGQTVDDWHVSNLTNNKLSGYLGTQDPVPNTPDTLTGDFRQSAANHTIPHGQLESNKDVAYGTIITGSLGAPNIPFVGFSSSVSADGRKVFYNNSVYDDPGYFDPSNDDFSAIAGDKHAHRPGDAQAGFAQHTSYNKGINGILIYLDGTHGTITASDFKFRTRPLGEISWDPNGGDGGPVWTNVGVAATVSVVTDTHSMMIDPSNPGPLGGPPNLIANPYFGKDAVRIIWADGAIKNTFLEVRMDDNPATTGLSANYTDPDGTWGDIFYYGNLYGNSGLGDYTSGSPADPNDPSFAFTDAADVLGARGNQVSDIFNQYNIYDYNRDDQVDAADVLTARGNQGDLGMIKVENPPHAPGGGGGDASNSGDSGVASALTAAASTTSAAQLGSSPINSGLSGEPSSGASISQVWAQLVEAETARPSKSQSAVDSLAADLGLDDDLLDSLAEDLIAALA